jgi:ATP phosphoribosyltransferase
VTPRNWPASASPAIAAAISGYGPGVDAQVVVGFGEIATPGQADYLRPGVQRRDAHRKPAQPVLTLLESEAVLAGPAADFDGVRAELMELLLRRLDGARIAAASCSCSRRRATVAVAVAVAADAEEPTVMQIDGESACCRRSATVH